MKQLVAAAIQAGVDPGWSPDEWSNHLRWQLASCREAGVDLAVFPAWTGVYMESFPRGFPEDALGTLIRLLGNLAKEACLHLVPGTVPVRCADGVRLRGFLFSPQGDLVGCQDQLGPPPGYTPGDDLAVLPSPWGDLAIIIGDDAFIPEVGRILALQGADLYCMPQALPGPYNPWRQYAGAWQIVQANQTPAIEACLIGDFLGLPHAGCSRLLSTVETTPDGRGVLAEAASQDRTEIVIGAIDFDALANARSSFPIFSQFNLDLYRHALAASYQKKAVKVPEWEADRA